MKEFWNQRYASEEYIYGTEPNEFFRSRLDQLEPGSILLPADGEGRNGVYAASKGWEVTCFDISEEARKKAERLAASYGVELTYLTGPLESHSFEPESFDVIALIFAHFPVDIRATYHKKFIQLLKPGGHILLQAYSKEQIAFQQHNPASGGPKNIDMLFSTDLLHSDFNGLDIPVLEKKTIQLNEGTHHTGKASVINMVTQKPVRP